LFKHYVKNCYGRIIHKYDISRKYEEINTCESILKFINLLIDNGLDSCSVETRKIYNIHVYHILGLRSIDINKKFVNKTAASFSKNRIVNLILKSKFNVGDQNCYNQKLIDYISSDLYNKIEWHKDFISGYTWPRTNLFDKNKVNEQGEIKLPWELSRLQHLSALSLNYSSQKPSHSGDMVVKEVIAQILDWKVSNKYYFGVNWVSPMEVSIRAVNLLIVYYCIIGSQYFTKTIKLIFNKILHQHLDYIINNYQYYKKQTNNHDLSHVTGMLFLSLHFASLDTKYKYYFNFAVNELGKEINNITFLEGSSIEGSAHYHQLITEMFLACTILSLLHINRNRSDNGFMKISSVWKIHPYRLNNLLPPSEVINKNFIKRIFLLVQFSRVLVKSSGRLMNIGDNDSSFLIDIGNNIDSSRETINKKNINILFNILKSIEIPSGQIDNFTKNPRQFKDETIYAKFGLKVLRNNNFWCGITFGKQGQRNHSHEDTFSYELCYKGIDLVVDPGSYIYSGNTVEREYFRSKNSHSTLSCDTNISSTNNLFYLNPAEEVKVLHNSINRFQGYYSNKGLSYKRTFRIQELSILISDEILDVPGRIFSRIILDPKLEIVEINDGPKFIFNLVYKDLKCTLFVSGFNSFSIEDGYISRGFYSKERNRKLVFFDNNNNNIVYKYICKLT